MYVMPSDPENKTLPKLYSSPVYFIPMQPQPSKFSLALRHVLPPEQIPEGVDPNILESVILDCNEREFKDAITIMNQKKRCHDNSTGNIFQEKVKRARGGRQGYDGQAGCDFFKLGCLLCRIHPRTMFLSIFQCPDYILLCLRLCNSDHTRMLHFPNSDSCSPTSSPFSTTNSPLN